MSLIIRPARRDDVVISALLLAETTLEFGVEVIGLGSVPLQVKALQEWFVTKGNRFSFEHTWIAEKYGVAAGLLLGFEGSKLQKLELGCGRRIFAIYGLFGAFKMVWRNKSLAGNVEAEKDEYLIAHLAVDEHFRRQGIAQSLIHNAVELASSKGIHKLVLEVEIDNHPAVALYRRMGFEVVNTVLFKDKAGIFKCPGFYKMLKSI
jgi:ribosomal protein S18 acetylase RimI-like enzyme